MASDPTASPMAFEPFRRLGPFFGGQSMESVKALFPEHSEFRKSPFAKVRTTEVIKKSAHIYYDENYKCKGVELFRPQTITLFGQDLSFESMNYFEKTLQDRGVERRVGAYGIESDSIGIKTFNPDFSGNFEYPIEALYVKFNY